MSKIYSKKEKTFNAGEIIFSENDECDGMYIIMKGRVRVFKTFGTDHKKELELVQLGPNCMFGEMALIDESKRSASVQAIEETETIIITNEMFKDQIQKIPLWMQNMIRILVKRLRDTNEKLREKTKNYEDDTGGLIYVSKDSTTDKLSAQFSSSDLDENKLKKSTEKFIATSEVILKDLGYKS